MCILFHVLWFYYVYVIVFGRMHAFFGDEHSLQVRANVGLFTLSDVRKKFSFSFLLFSLLNLYVIGSGQSPACLLSRYQLHSRWLSIS